MLGGSVQNFIRLGGPINDLSGNTRIQIISTGSDRALNLCDDTGVATLVITEGGVTLPASTLNLAPSLAGGLNFDPSSYLFGDGSGNVALIGTTLTVSPTTSGSTGTIFGSQLNATVAPSGSATAIGNENNVVITGTTSGKKWMETWGTSTGNPLSGVDSNGNFIKSTFSAAQSIYVDGTNGNDTRGNGTGSGPYATIAHALSVAASGNAVIVGPGIYTVSSSTMVIPAGVSLVGSGIDITVIEAAASSGTSQLIYMGNGSVASDFSLLGTTTTTNRAPIGIYSTTISGNFSYALRRLRINGNIDGVYNGLPSTGTTNLTYTVDDCIITSFYDCTQDVQNSGTNTIVGAYTNTKLTSTFRSGGSSILRLFPGQAVYTLSGCVGTITDTTNSSPSGVYCFGATTVPGTSTAMDCTFIQNTPSISAPFVTNWPNKMGAGNTLISILSGGTTITELPSTPSTLTVTSSAVTPGVATLNEVAVDAATLGSDTLTVNNSSFNALSGEQALLDGQALNLRITNTNASSTAMTLAFGTNFNLGSTSVGTIAAGKSAYLTFKFRAATSKWDLTGFINGL